MMMMLKKDIDTVLEYIKSNKDYLEKKDKEAYDQIISLLDGTPEKREGKIFINANGKKTSFTYKLVIPSKWITEMHLNEEKEIAMFLNKNKLLIMPAEYFKSYLEQNNQSFMNADMNPDEFLKYSKITTVYNGKNVAVNRINIPKDWIEIMNLSPEKKEIFLTKINSDLISVEACAVCPNEITYMNADFSKNKKGEESSCRILIPQKYISSLGCNLESSQLFMVRDNKKRLFITAAANAQCLLDKYESNFSGMKKDDCVLISPKSVILNNVQNFRLAIPVTWMKEMGVTGEDRQLVFTCTGEEYILSKSADL